MWAFWLPCSSSCAYLPLSNNLSAGSFYSILAEEDGRATNKTQMGIAACPKDISMVSHCRYTSKSEQTYRLSIEG